MYTKEDHLKAGQQTINGLEEIKTTEIKKANKCRFYQRKKKNHHLKRAEQMQEYIDEMGKNPTSFRAALIIPDSILAGMGWD